MTQSASENRCHIGFLRITQTEQGYIGGLLVTNHHGRPLEFQCTTPVRPNRTQEILYGPTLQPFLFAELIGKTLIERVSIRPQLLLIQQEHLLELREQVQIPVACLISDKEDKRDLPDQTRIQLGRHQMRLHQGFPEDLDQLSSFQSRIPNDADMAEPLDRVQDALQETLRAGAA